MSTQKTLYKSVLPLYSFFTELSILHKYELHGTMVHSAKGFSEYTLKYPKIWMRKMCNSPSR